MIEPWPTLSQELRRLNVGQLERLAALICGQQNIDFDVSPARMISAQTNSGTPVLLALTATDRYTELIKFIDEQLLDPRVLRTLWDALGDLERSTIVDTLFMNSGRFRSAPILAKYGALPDFGETSWGNWRSNTAPPIIKCFLPNGRIPMDLARALIAFIPREVAPPQLDAYDELPEKRLKNSASQLSLTTCDTAIPAQHDVQTVLRLAEAGKLGFSERSLQPTPDTISMLVARLYGGEFYPSKDDRLAFDSTIGPIKSFAWPCLILAAGFTQIRKEKLVLTKSGFNALDAPPASVIKQIWTSWIGNTLFEEFRRVDWIRGQYGHEARQAMFDAERRRIRVAETLRLLPEGKWVEFDEFCRVMRALWLEFELFSDTRMLSLEKVKYDRLFFDGANDWKNLSQRYILCLLMEYAATLGLIDIAHVRPENAGRDEFRSVNAFPAIPFLSRYDGLMFIRVNKLGAYCLSSKRDVTFEYRGPISASNSITVRSNLMITLLKDSDVQDPMTNALLDTFADRETDSTWRLSRSKALAAVERGRHLDELETFLQSHDDQPLPETVEGFIKETQKNSQALQKAGTAVIIECCDAQLAERIASNPVSKKLCQRLGDKHLIVKTADEEPFRQAIHTLGYGMPRE